MNPVVYFIQSGDDGPIKIGTTGGGWGGALSRRSTFQTGNAEKLELRAVMPGGYERERALHKRFAAHNLHGEWYKPVPEILALVESLAPKQSRVEPEVVAEVANRLELPPVKDPEPPPCVPMKADPLEARLTPGVMELINEVMFPPVVNGEGGFTLVAKLRPGFIAEHLRQMPEADAEKTLQIFERFAETRRFIRESEERERADRRRVMELKPGTYEYAYEHYLSGGICAEEFTRVADNL